MENTPRRHLIHVEVPTTETPQRTIVTWRGTLPSMPSSEKGVSDENVARFVLPGQIMNDIKGYFDVDHRIHSSGKKVQYKMRSIMPETPLKDGYRLARYPESIPRRISGGVGCVAVAALHKLQHELHEIHHYLPTLHKRSHP